MNTLKYRTLIRLIRKIDDKTVKGTVKENFRKYIFDGTEIWKKVKESNESIVNPFIDTITDQVEFNDALDFFRTDYRKYSVDLQGTTFCTFFYGKFDVNSINNDGDTIVSLLAIKSELTLDIIKFFSQHDFNYLHQYIVNGKYLSITDILIEKLKDMSRTPERKGVINKGESIFTKIKITINYLLDAMEIQAKKSTECIAGYQRCRKNYEDYLATNCRQYEILELQEKVKKLEVENQKIPKLEKRVSDIENELSSLRALITQNKENKNKHHNGPQRSWPNNRNQIAKSQSHDDSKTLIPNRRSGGGKK